jgi:phosphatidylglycerophosphatase A
MIGSMLSGWELVIILAIVFMLVSTKMFTEPLSGKTNEREPLNQADFLLWVAQGFGVGRIPFGPGTFGSVLGVLWFAVLLRAQSLWLLLAGIAAGIALSVWLCGVAEKILQQADPGSVVLDEIAALPVCFLGWFGILFSKNGSFPGLDDFFGAQTWPLAAGVFAAFRFFDITKPWPVRQSQSLPGGWGVTIDDVLAAIYVNAVVVAIYVGKVLMSK